MTLHEITQLRVDAIEQELLTSPFISATEMSKIIELARLTRRAINAPTKLKPIERKALNAALSRNVRHTHAAY